MKPSSTPIRVLCAAPRAHLFTVSRTLASSTINARHLSISHHLRKDEASTPFSPQRMAAPPRLPKEEQEIFESLQRQSTGAFSTPLSERRSPPKINQSPDSSPAEVADAQSTIEQRVDKIAAASETPEGGEQSSKFKDMYDKVIEARGKGEELHPNVRRGAQPEFEGEVNPKTGEVGGPKNDPLRWGASSEWTYNGRATDF
ncbi:hypothetical protein H2200_006761 [Cladophialophora chaetospira]|uniref:Succinate dehydrogenase assembly factor 4, mitochondrial n=1 Tax=Cladophialophora chaetospira TaxID=386627 RepID=A0AA38X901_9EURO|nr:hypothetical protein H2200_006761 [Cladophialophora chaetospira]